ncbi:hypothetical protein ILUMI_16151 [Ignelater luminosus]|uniref:Uncharacterized protein n=1 Tax=Ignelater luminosus TaxID=2038154 RepID=A0A8K0G680_IGNLU|nr:hypothetical protein ILUMI_16151 [Ignelater luminosus]
MFFLHKFGGDARAALNYNSVYQNDADFFTKASAKSLGFRKWSVPYFWRTWKVEEVFEQLMQRREPVQWDKVSRRLLLNQLSDCTEMFMNIVCKYVSGKRINYAKRGSYSRPVDAAASAFNNRELWLLKRINSDKKCCSSVWTKANKSFTRFKRQKRKEKTIQNSDTKSKSGEYDYDPEVFEGCMPDA